MLRSQKDSQESPVCRGKNNILRRDLDMFKRSIFKECKHVVNKDNRVKTALRDNITRCQDFKQFQFETELAWQLDNLRRFVDAKYLSMAPDDKDRIFGRWKRQIRDELLARFEVPVNKWKEAVLDEPNLPNITTSDGADDGYDDVDEDDDGDDDYDDYAVSSGIIGNDNTNDVRNHSSYYGSRMIIRPRVMTTTTKSRISFLLDDIYEKDVRLEFY